MVSDKYRCICVHVLKVAGRSIEQFFLDLHGLTWEQRNGLLLRHNSDHEAGPGRLANLLAAEYVDCEYIARETFSQYFTYRHAISQYDYLYDCDLPYRNAIANKKPGLGQTLKNLFSPPPPQNLPYTEYYDDEPREHVGQIYTRDISTFGYRFE